MEVKGILSYPSQLNVAIECSSLIYIFLNRTGKHKTKSWCTEEETYQGSGKGSRKIQRKDFDQRKVGATS